jgi:hypothetical protein
VIRSSRIDVAVLDQALGLLDHHFRDLHVAHRQFIEGRGITS